MMRNGIGGVEISPLGALCVPADMAILIYLDLLRVSLLEASVTRLLFLLFLLGLYFVLGNLLL